MAIRHAHDIAKPVTTEPDNELALEAANEMWQQARALADSLLGPDWTIINVEERLWLKDHNGDPIASGQPDIVIQSEAGRTAIVIDGKSIRFAEHDEAADNWQISSLVALVGSNYDQRHEMIYAAIVQPGTKPIPVAYGVDEITDSLTHWLNDIEAAQQPNAPRRAGKHCDYCKAKADCPEFIRSVESVALAKLPPSDGIEARDYSGKDVADFRIKCGVMRGLIEKAIAWADAMAKQGLEQRPEEFGAYFELQESKGKDTIINLEKVLSHMQQLGVPQSEFMRCLTARKADSATTGEPGLEGVLRRATDLKGKGLKDALSECLAGCVKEGQTKQVPAVKEAYKNLTS